MTPPLTRAAGNGAKVHQRSKMSPNSGKCFAVSKKFGNFEPLLCPCLGADNDRSHSSVGQSI